MKTLVPTTKTAITDAVRQQAPANLLADLVAFRSVTGNAEQTHKLLSYVADYLEERGMHIKWFEQNEEMYEALIATTRPNIKTPTVFLAAHADVIDGPDELFTLQKKDGNFVGRGVLDMKCAIAAYMQTVDDLYQQSTLAEHDFGIMLTSDEELGSKDGINGAVQFIKLGYIPKMLILPDGGDQNWQMETSANGYLHYRLEASGRAAHSSRPWEGDSATFKLVSALHEIKDYFKDHGPETDTLNIGSIHSDHPVNRVPDSAHAELSIRVHKREGPEHWEQIVANICAQHDVKLVVRASWGPVFNSIDNPYVRAYADITREVTGIQSTGHHSLGGSDARFFGELGVPYANAYPRGGAFHSDNEWLAEASLEQLHQIVAEYVRTMTNTKQPAQPIPLAETLVVSPKN